MAHLTVEAAALADVWNRAAASHPLGPELLEEITWGDPSFREGDVLCEYAGDRLCGFAIAKRLRKSALGCERYATVGYVPLLAVDPIDQGRGVGTRLLNRAEAHLAMAGATTVVLGGSFHHAVPGIPDSLESGFFLNRGYHPGPGPTWDVSRDVRNFELPARVGADLAAAGVEPRLVSTRYGMSVDPVATASLLEFLAAEFPGRWCRDVAHALGRLDDGAHVMTLFSGWRAIGFAQLHLPRTPGALRWCGFDPDVAAIGPVGVARDFQGRGLGLAIVALASAHLQRSGGRRVVIDWTDLLDFYGKLRYEPWLSYTPASKTL